MKKVSVDFGCYYNSLDQKTLVRTVAAMKDIHGENEMIAFVYVTEGGVASPLHYMPKQDFISTYIS